MFSTRKIQALAVAGTLAIVMSACGSSSSDDADSTSTTAAANSATTGDTSATTAAGGTATAGAVKVEIKDYAFSPSTLTIKAGQTVTWTNSDSVTHTVTSGANRTSDGKYDHSLAPGATFSWTYKTAGTYDYYCKPHTNMVAKVIVQ